jgi:diguanylate cyclase
MTASPERSARRILVIDDNEDIHADFRKILAAPERSDSYAAAKAALFGAADDAASPSSDLDIQVDSATQGQEGVAKAAEALRAGTPYHVAFVDMRMPPGWDGLKTIQQLWAIDPSVEVVICTAYSDHSLEALGPELGNTNKLLVLKKPFDNVEIRQLARTLSEKWVAERAAALRLNDLEQIVHERTATIEHAALHDRLTGLANRALLLQRLERCLQVSRRAPQKKFAVLFLDFDRFKLINDSFGHAIGDQVLKEIAERLRASMRDVDLMCDASTPSRLGGDEFIVLLEDLRETRDAVRVAQRLLDALATPHRIDGQDVCITASIGIATSDRDYQKADEVIRDADTAMYRAKAEGRARYVVFDRAMHAEVMNRLSVENRLRAAVQADRITLHYQPVVRLRDGRLVGFEALVRWTDPEHGPMPASKIIEMAEDSGLIVPMGLAILRQACRQLCSWQEQFETARAITMSVNLSPRQLATPDLVGSVGRILTETGVLPTSLVLEITETALLSGFESAQEIFTALRRMGIGLHLDDFGTGYSSLGCLHRLPLTAIKIDRAFTQEINVRPAQMRVLEAIVAIARALQLEVTVEGIETAEQLDTLRGLAVDHGQGYYFGKPAPPERAAELLQAPQAFAALVTGAL